MVPLVWQKGVGEEKEGCHEEGDKTDALTPVVKCLKGGFIVEIVNDGTGQTTRANATSWLVDSKRVWIRNEGGRTYDRSRIAVVAGS